MSNEKVDVLIIGAGPSGAVSAAIVNKEGLKVKVVEKQTFPRYVIGESMIPTIMEPLEEAGFMDRLNKQGYQKKYGARFIRDNKTCTFDFSDQFTDGWTWTWQLPRAHFDNCLTEELIERGIDIDFNTSVKNIQFNESNSVTTVVNGDGQESEIEAKFIIDASGYGRVIARQLDLDEPSTLPPRASIFTQLKDNNRPDGYEGTMITFIIVKQDVWFWMIPFSNGNTSIGFVGNPDYFDTYTGTNEEKLRKMVSEVDYYAKRFKNVSYLFEPKAIKGYSKGVKSIYGNGYALTGNSSEFLDPIFSSGVAFALAGGQLAAKLACKQLKGEPVDWEKEYQEEIYYGVDVFRTYINAWYDGSLQNIFFADNINSEFKKQICSVLAGYVWDKENPFVSKHERAISSLFKVINLTEA